MYLKSYRNLKNSSMHPSFFNSFNMTHTGFSCSSTWNNTWYCFLSFCLFTWNTAGATIASSSLKVAVKGQKSKDKDKTPLLQGSIQFSLIRQSCHWNQWQLCLNKKGRIGILVLLVCNNNLPYMAGKDYHKEQRKNKQFLSVEKCSLYPLSLERK